MRPWVVGLIVMGWTTTGAARPPACFPERTLSIRSELHDLEGRPIGLVGRDTTVRVIEEAIDEGGQWATIELSKPVLLIARVKMRQLSIEARRELVAREGFAWWTKGTPLQILDAKPAYARVLSATLAANAETAAANPWADGLSPSWTACTDLVRPVPEQPATGGCCARRGGIHDRPRGRYAELREGVLWPLVVVSRDGQAKAEARPDGMGILRRRARQAFVELFDDRVGIKLHGWIDSELIEERPYVEYGYASSCAYVMFDRGLPTTQLLEDAGLSATRDGDPITTLPKGALLGVLEQQDGMTKVQFVLPVDSPSVLAGGETDGPQIVLIGWVVATATTSSPRTELPMDNR